MSQTTGSTGESASAAIARLVDELNISPRQISAVAQLLAAGNTIPFVARYRKEMHGNLDEVQIGKIQERLTYYRELEDRRQTILKSIDEQGKLTDDLRDRILACDIKSALEDLYLPFKPKRRTRAMIAREKGLEPLSDLIISQNPSGNPAADAADYVDPDKGVNNTDEALAGARDIVAEIISENADIRSHIRAALTTEGLVVSEVATPRPTQPTKFEQYYDFREAISTIPSHRYLAIRRGQAEGVLRYRLEVDNSPLVEFITAQYEIASGTPYGEQMQQAAEDAYKRLLEPSIEVDVSVELKLKSDRAAVEIFAENLRNLLLAAPMGEKRVIGIDPGLRTGCKCAVLDSTGKFLDTTTIYITRGSGAMIEAKVELCKLINKYSPEAIAVGNGTGGRETEQFVREVLRDIDNKSITVVSVSEAGASVYSASEVARDEFPDLDLTVRGAISIGRRLLDPLAELVKIDPKAIGVGQYQHDVHQPLLAAKLDEVVVSCVNHVGVELNTASAPLLARVSGIGNNMATKIVEYRNANGAFKTRKELMKVPSLGPRTFEQAAGFLRIRGAENPLDSSAVHPERYDLVAQMAADLAVDLNDMVGNAKIVDAITPRKYASDEVGELTLKDIIDELKKPGRDPRATFEKSGFLEDVTAIEHVKPGMVIEGIVTNVTAFGAFVDIGVHQDGLVHVSELADRYVRDPSEVVKTGQRLKVKVLEVDLDRKRISLTARSQPSSTPARGPAGKPSPQRRGSQHGAPRRSNPGQGGFSNNPFAGL